MTINKSIKTQARCKAGPDPELAECYLLTQLAETEHADRRDREQEIRRERSARKKHKHITKPVVPPVTCEADEPEHNFTVDRRSCFTMTMAAARRTVNTGLANHDRKITAKLEKERILAWDRQTGEIQPTSRSTSHATTSSSQETNQQPNATERHMCQPCPDILQ